MVADESGQDSTLNKVARTVGSALGTVASKVTDVVATKSDDDPKPETKADKGSTSELPHANKNIRKGTRDSGNESPQAPANKSAAKKTKTDHGQHAQSQKKAKRAKHHRKLGRKTRG